MESNLSVSVTSVALVPISVGTGLSITGCFDGTDPWAHESIAAGRGSNND